MSQNKRSKTQRSSGGGGARSHAYRAPVASVILLATLSSAFGQAQPGLEEIVVTAQKRAESAQNVPVSITAFDSAALRDMRADNPADLAQYVPNLSSTSSLGGGVPIFSLRGVSMNDYSPNQSSAVAVYMDEVYRGTPALMGPQIYDLERVEVLRGPQGTLYGKNTTGGAINFITARPGYETEGYLGVGLGNFQRWEAQGAAQAGLSDTVAARLAFTYADADGYTENLLPGHKDLDGIRQYGLRLSLLWQASEDLEFLLRASTGESSGTAHGIVPVAGPDGVGGGVYALFNAFDPATNPSTDYFRVGLDAHQNEANRVYKQFVATDSVSLTINYDVSDNFLLTSITSWDDGQYRLPEDTDGSPLDLLFINFDFDAHQVAQDLRLSSDLGGPFDFIAGAYLSREVVQGGTSIAFYSDIDVNFDGALDYQDCIDSAASIGTETQVFPVGCTTANNFEQTRDSAALYFDGSHALSDAWKLRFGARYTRDDGKMQKFRSLLLGSDRITLANLIPGDPEDPGATTKRRYSNSELTGRIGLDYATSNGNLLYASVSRGFRSSAFNGSAYFDPSELNVVDPEQLDAAEVGFKLDLIQQTLRLNGALFWYGYRDQQFLDVDAATTAQRLINIPESTIVGGELESIYRVTDYLRLNGSVAFLRAEIDKGRLSGVNLAGNTLPLAPDYSVRLGIDWDIMALRYGDLTLMIDGSYVDSQYFEVFNEPATQQKGYALGNARLALHPSDKGLEVAVWVKNLADEKYRTSMINLLDNFGYVYSLMGPPRTYGAEVTWRF